MGRNSVSIAEELGGVFALDPRTVENLKDVAETLLVLTGDADATYGVMSKMIMIFRLYEES